MAKEKITGVGATLEIDFTGADTTYDAIECCSEITPPGYERETVNAECLEDDESPPVPGGANMGEATYSALWQPLDTIEEKVDTAFLQRTIVNVKITYPYSTVVEEKFDGFISSVQPGPLNRTDLVNRDITIQRTTPITRANPGP